MNLKKLPLVLVALSLTLLLGCEEPPIEELGTLQVNVAGTGEASPATLPELDVDIVTYEIEIIGPGAPELRTITPDAPTAIFGDLIPGMWAVNVFARNSDGVVVGSGSDVVEVFGIDPAPVSIVVAPVDGTGNLAVALSWSGDVFGDPQLEAFVVDGDEQRTDLSMVFDFDKTSASGVLSLDDGYYTLVARLSNGSAEIWSLVKAVRILSGQATPVRFLLQPEDLNLGDVEVTIEEQMDEPFAVSILGLQDTISVGENLRLTAVTDLDPATAASLSYIWYLDGVPLPEATGPDLMIGADFSSDFYQFSVVVRHGDVSGSSSGGVTIAPATDS